MNTTGIKTTDFMLYAFHCNFILIKQCYFILKRVNLHKDYSKTAPQTKISIKFANNTTHLLKYKDQN